jgi:hypothetical protein
MRTVFDIVPAEGYAVLKPSRGDTQDYLAKMNDGIESPARGVFEKLIERRALVASLGSADVVVLVGLDDAQPRCRATRGRSRR